MVSGFAHPVLALVGPGRVVGPHFQDDLQRLAGHVAVLPAHAVDVNIAQSLGRPDAAMPKFSRPPER